MATGRLGTPADLAATTLTTLYTVPVGTFAVVTVSLCNRGTSNRAIRLAIASSGTPSNAEYIEYDAEILPNGVLERTGIVVDAGKNIVVYAGGTDISAMVYGIETSTA